MYPLVSALSLFARFYLCFITIERLPIFVDDTANWIFGQVLSIYTVFRLICYPLVGFISERLDIRSATVRSIMYFLLYLPLVGIYWFALMILTSIFGILPIKW